MSCSSEQHYSLANSLFSSSVIQLLSVIPQWTFDFAGKLRAAFHYIRAVKCSWFHP